MRLFIIFLLVIFFPLVQKQWLNLYLFDSNNFTIYKLLYYLSGLIIPILVIVNSFNKFTFYKFKNNKINNNLDISGKLLLFITSTFLLILSTLISSYILINLRILLNLFIVDSNVLVNIELDKQILIIVILSILLLFKKYKLIIKKVLLINFLIMSFIIWYSEVNNIILNDIFLIDILKFKNINLINLLFFVSIEILYYLWSYISYSTYLSDWRVPRPEKKEIGSILYIIFFYSLIMIYYSVLF